MQMTRPLNAVLIAGLVIVLGCNREAGTTVSNSTVQFVETSATAVNVTDYIENRAFDVVGVLKIGAEAAPGRFYQLSDAILIDEKSMTRASRSD